MRWQVIDIIKRAVTGEKEEEETKQEYLKKIGFSLEHARIDALIPPDKDAEIEYVSNDKIIFKSMADVLPGESTMLQITCFDARCGSKQTIIDITLKIKERGKLNDKRFIYISGYTVKNDPKVLELFGYLSNTDNQAKQAEEDYSERRKHYRLKRALPIVSKNIDGYKALTANISTGGVMLDGGAARDIKKGDVINLRLELDDSTSEPMFLKAEVCWVTAGGKSKMNMGVEFIDLSETERKLIANYIEGIRKVTER